MVQRKSSIEVTPPTGSVIFDISAMCQDCPALAKFGACREDLKLGYITHHLSRTDSLDVDDHYNAVWGCTIVDGADNSFDSVFVDYHGLPGEVLQPHNDTFIEAANRAVGECALRGRAGLQSDRCGLENFGVGVDRSYREYGGIDDRGDVIAQWVRSKIFANPRRY